MIYYISIMTLICLCESLFCYLMKRYNRNKAISKIQIDENENNSKKQEKKISFFRKIINHIVTYANDFTFWFFKIVGYIPSHFIRMIFYRYIFHMDLGKKVIIYYGLEARCPWLISIKDGTIVGDKVIMDARFGITIGSNVNISTGAWMWTLQHDINSRTFSSDGKGSSIEIGNRAWISSRTTILPGVCIGQGAVIAAGAVVTKKGIDEFSVWGGVPARKIGSRSTEIDYVFEGKHRLFL